VTDRLIRKDDLGVWAMGLGRVEPRMSDPTDPDLSHSSHLCRKPVGVVASCVLGSPSSSSSFVLASISIIARAIAGEHLLVVN